MPTLLKTLSRTTFNLFNPRMLWFWSWPLLASAALWWTIGFFFWTPLSGWLLTVIPVETLQNWLGSTYLNSLANGIETFINLIIFTLLVLVTSLIITALFSMTELVNFVAKRYYPNLARLNGGTLSGSLRNISLAIAVYIVIWVITVPLWFMGAGLLVPLLAAAYLNQRLFLYDALSIHADQSELDELQKTNFGSRWSLGLLTGFLQFVPILNLFSPTFTALAFIHFELARLDQLRRTAKNTEVSLLESV